MLQVLISNGDGTFRDETTDRYPAAPVTHLEDFKLHDFNNDGHLDLFSNIDFSVNDIYINDGEGYFRPLITDFLTNLDFSWVVLDVDGDGGSDIISSGGEGLVLHKMIQPYGPNLNGSEQDDRLIGGAHDNIYRGFAGNDVLDGGLGDDWLEGGPGNDDLLGGQGDDLFVLNLVDLSGHDRISDKGGKETVLFSDFNLDEVILAWQGDDYELILEFASGGSLTIENHFRGDGFSVEQIETADGKHSIRKTPTFESGGVHDLLDIGQDLIYYKKQLQDQMRGVTGRLSRSRGR